MGNTHKDLEIWKQGIELVVRIYQATQGLPKDEEYGLKSQMRRAAVSYPSNIAEGAARASRRGYTQFLRVSLGSLSELETQVIIADRLGFLKGTPLLEEVEALRRKTLNLIKYMKTNRSDQAGK
ncbi:MAG TPA: four helix bundle protein [Sedimentisphaerales bacterium]|jgi:four helix bundle protein|nr:four helix bundle protein [Sedimentisphaerales bacterium]HNU30408.1 four helix bundle protein [Sedimentisphaerales bacterium]